MKPEPVRCTHCGEVIQEAAPRRSHKSGAVTCLRCCDMLGVPVNRMLGAIRRHRAEWDEPKRDGS